MTSFLPTLTQDNFSLHTIPISWLIAVTPRLWSRYTYYTHTGQDMDIRHPRQFSWSVDEDNSIPPEARGRIIRAEAAMSNGFDNVPLFAAAVVAGNAAKLSAQMLNGLSLTYLACRIAFNVVYVRNMPISRTVAFFGGLGSCFALFLKAGAAFEKAAK